MGEAGQSGRRLACKRDFRGLDDGGDGDKWMNQRYRLKQRNLPTGSTQEVRNQSKF